MVLMPIQTVCRGDRMNKIFRDEYTDFTFNGVQSSQLKVWITNNRDLQFRLTPEFSDTFINPTFSNTQILSSTNITKSTISLKCIAIDVSMQDWRAIQQWLSPTVVGRLSFDFNDRTYYNAKISKSIVGTSFVKGMKDNLNGDKYIIEFSVDFTTVGDYAALGEVNVGVIGLNFDQHILGEETVSSIDDYLYKIESVSNNKFYIPSFVKMPVKTLLPTDGTSQSGSSIIIPAFEKINNRKLLYSSDNRLSDAVGYLYDMSSKIGESFYPCYSIRYIAEDVGDCLLVEKYYYDSEGRENKSTGSYSVEIKRNPENNKLEAELVFFGEELFFFTQARDGEKPVWSFVTDSQVTDYAVCNTGAYDMYPVINSDGIAIKVIKEKEVIYDYAFSESVGYTIDGQNGFILSQGQPIENTSYEYGRAENIYRQQIVTNFENNGILSIKTGNPQLIKTFLKEKSVITAKVLTFDSSGEPITDSSGKKVYASVEIGTVLNFISPEEMQFNHRGNVLIHIFKNVIPGEAFNTKTYPLFIQEGNPNFYDNEIVGSLLLEDSMISCCYNNIKDCYEYTIYSPRTIRTEDSESAAKEISLNSSYYMSVCDYEMVSLNMDHGFIYLQTRDAF